MLKSFRGSVLLVLVSLVMPLLSACSGGGGGGGALVPQNCNLLPPITTDYKNPVGQTNPTKGTPWQITEVSTALTEGNQYLCEVPQIYHFLTVNVKFVQDVSTALPPVGTSLNSPTQLGVSIGIDSDSNPKTGSYGGCNNYIPPVNSNEYISDDGGSGRGADGSYVVAAPSTALGSTALGSVSGHTFTEIFNLNGIGITNLTDPTFRIDVGAANGQSGTECVPANAEFGVNPAGIFNY